MKLYSKGFNKNYAALAFMLGLYLLLTHTFMRQLIVEHSGSAKVLNLAGRQRMLSQRISKHLLMKNWDAAREDFKTLQSRQKDLSLGNPKQGIHKPHSNEIRHIYKSLGKKLQALAPIIDCHSTHCPLDETTVQRAVSDLNIFLKQMDETVFLTEKVTAANLITLSRYEFLFILFGFFIFSLSFLFIVRPMARSINRHMERVRKARRELQKAKSDLRLAIDGANLGVWDWNLKTDNVAFDKNWASMLGLDLETLDMRIETWASRVHPDDLYQAYADIKDYMDGKTEFYENIHRMKHVDGHWVYILDRGRFSEFDTDGQPTRFTGTHLDITESRRLQDEQRLVLTNTGTGLWKWDNNRNLLTWDENMYQVYNINIEDFPNTIEGWEYLLHPDSQGVVRSTLETAVRENQSVECQFLVNTQSGLRFIGMRTYVERGPDGSPRYVYGINWDRTREYEAEKELEEQKSLAFHKTKLASIGELAAGVGHEINNPLAILQGQIDLLKLRHSQGLRINEEDLFKTIQKFQKSITRIADIVRGLKSFTRIDSSQEDVFEISDTLVECVQMVNGIYGVEGIQIEFEDQLTTPQVIRGHRGKIQQVILNLLSNARDAIKGVENPNIKITLLQKGPMLQLRVQDNGTGIPDKVKSHIFEPFFTTKKTGEGTGIGLPIVMKIINEHQGQLSFDSQPGRTVFICDLPVYEKPALLPMNPPIEIVQNSLNNIRILLLDDETDIAETVGSLLQGHGYHVDFFDSPTKALQFLKDNPTQYDVILSDMKMPDMNGIEFFHEVRNLQAGAYLLLMTGGVDRLDSGDLQGPDGILSKPFNIDELVIRLNQITTSEFAA